MRKKRIYTRESLDKMSTDEFSQKEEDIMAQMRNISIPYFNDLTESQKKQNQNFEQKDQEIKEYFITNSVIQDILELLDLHTLRVGKKQAIKDFQRGINILNKGKGISRVQDDWKLRQDGVLGDKTTEKLAKLTKYYSPEVIKKYIRRGIINNVIFDTKNNPRINTQHKIDTLLDNLNIKRRKY